VHWLIGFEGDDNDWPQAEAGGPWGPQLAVSHRPVMPRVARGRADLPRAAQRPPVPPSQSVPTV